MNGMYWLNEARFIPPQNLTEEEIARRGQDLGNSRRNMSPISYFEETMDVVSRREEYAHVIGTYAVALANVRSGDDIKRLYYYGTKVGQQPWHETDVRSNRYGDAQTALGLLLGEKTGIWRPGEYGFENSRKYHVIAYRSGELESIYEADKVDGMSDDMRRILFLHLAVVGTSSLIKERADEERRNIRGQTRPEAFYNRIYKGIPGNREAVGFATLAGAYDKLSGTLRALFEEKYPDKAQCELARVITGLTVFLQSSGLNETQMRLRQLRTMKIWILSMVDRSDFVGAVKALKLLHQEQPGIFSDEAKAYLYNGPVRTSFELKRGKPYYAHRYVEGLTDEIAAYYGCDVLDIPLGSKVPQRYGSMLHGRALVFSRGRPTPKIFDVFHVTTTDDRKAFGYTYRIEGEGDDLRLNWMQAKSRKPYAIPLTTALARFDLGHLESLGTDISTNDFAQKEKVIAQMAYAKQHPRDIRPILESQST